MVGSQGRLSTMIPKIRQLQIHNYKSIGGAVVDLEPLTVLVGANGTGKSNFLDALSFIQESVSRSPGHAIAHHGKHRVAQLWQRGGPVGFRILLDLAESITADYSFEIVWPAEDDWPPSSVRVSHERCSIRKAGALDIGFEVADGRFVQEIPGIRPRLSADRLALFAASGIDEFRPLYDFLAAMKLYAIDPHSTGYSSNLDSEESLKPDGGNSAAILKLLEEQEPERYARLCRLLASAVEGVQSVSTQITEGVATLMFQQDIGRAEPGALYGWEMSEGTLRLLGLLLAVYQPQRPSLVAIEEPEATVHPAVAELVLQVLMDAAQDLQVLITTHSPDILDAKELDDRQIRVVTMEHGRTSIAPISRASRDAIREHLFTAGELMRSDELSQDVQAAEESARSLNLFGEITVPSPMSSQHDHEELRTRG